MAGATITGPGVDIRKVPILQAFNAVQRNGIRVTPGDVLTVRGPIHPVTVATKTIRLREPTQGHHAQGQADQDAEGSGPHCSPDETVARDRPPKEMSPPLRCGLRQARLNPQHVGVLLFYSSTCTQRHYVLLHSVRANSSMTYGAG